MVQWSAPCASSAARELCSGVFPPWQTAQKKTAAQPSWSEQPFVLRSFLRLSSGRRQRFFLCTDNTGLVEDKVSSLLGFGRGGEDGLAVVLEDLQPVVDVLRMAHVLERDAGLRAQEGTADLGHQFFEGIAEVSGAGAEHPVQPGRVPGPVADSGSGSHCRGEDAW